MDTPAKSAGGKLHAVRVGELEGMPNEERWLIEGVWASSGVGFVAGQPKTGKTFLSLECAIAVASGLPALGRYPVPEPGPVLFFPAEDDPRAARDRIAAIAEHRGGDMGTLPLFVITDDQLHIDDEHDRAGLESLLEEHRPKLLVLDPLVRIHSGDENYAGHISELLGYLRSLERRFKVAIMVTHHISKSANRRGGQALRGSGDLHAWSDSSLYLERDKEGRTELSFEHRSAPAPEPVELVLTSLDSGGAYFEARDLDVSEHDGGGRRVVRNVVLPPRRSQKPLRDRILGTLEASEEALSQVSLRKSLHVRNKTLTAVLHELQNEGAIERVGKVGGWKLCN